MGRPKNIDSVYQVNDAVTKEEIKTNPKQFLAMAERYGISEAELKTSFVGQKGRKVLLAEKLSPEDTVTKYGIHINVAQKLRCTVKPKAPRKVKEKVDTTPEAV